MIEIFITDIQTEIQADDILKSIKSENPELKFSFDFDETGLPFPCGHTVLRVEGDCIHSDKLLTTLKSLEINCEILEDKACV